MISEATNLCRSGFFQSGFTATAIDLIPLIQELENPLFSRQLDSKNAPLIGSASIGEPAVVGGNNLS